jgi:hypothetical protein
MEIWGHHFKINDETGDEILNFRRFVENYSEMPYDSDSV